MHEVFWQHERQHWALNIRPPYQKFDFKTILYHLNMHYMLFLFITAERIHLSKDTKILLDMLGGYHIESRGEIEIKVGHIERSVYDFLISQGLYLYCSLIFPSVTIFLRNML